MKAAKLGADYLQVGTMFMTPSHPEKLEVEGPGLLREIVEVLKGGGEGILRDRVLLCGIGGINKDNCGEVIGAGADGVAVINAISMDVAASVEGIRTQMLESWNPS